MNPRRLAALAFLLFSPLLSGCDFNLGTRVSWSPSGRSVAFLSKGRPFVYDMISGRLQKIVTPVPTANQIAWSSEEGLLAVSTNNVVEMISESEGRYAASSVYVAPELPAATDYILTWHPRERRILLAQFGDKIQTSEISASTAAIDTAPGLAAYGPGGGWLLWLNQAPLGHARDSRTIASREVDRNPAPLDAADQAVIEDEGTSMLYALGNPLCFTQSHEKRDRVRCFDAAGKLMERASIPHGTGLTYVDRREGLFAVIDDSVTIVDSSGRVRATGTHLAQALERESAKEWESNWAWSPDGNWLAFVADGRLVLWNWRNDLARILPKLD